ncbi:uncharacterized protein LOC113214724 isoform X3 [Frankliniella occidentalis]|uniref:Uncharacterized protein LOC113214724 isoform X3 n=1 Tax=Frankliniella occidentalis TaxID=133901 RepID=A0A9C6XUF8_FRAOC|nr:uncharacterized protein LOC113214724 isoform X3 [Frankliniella occidentalis]
MEDIARALLEILLGDTSVRGLRVVRGPDWKWGDQDGGAGFLGTVEKCMGSTVSVLWDNGSRNKYRTGLDGNYDLRIVDNATAGVSHNVICDECNDRPLKGIRWKCVPCSDYDLCSACYHAGKHDLLHKFYRIDTPSSDGVEVGTRKDASTWTLKGIFQGARVQRGLDWSWDDQDGGKGGKGTVLKITDGSKKTNSWRSWADVQWDHGKKNSYRVGAKGFVDLQFTTNAEGGSYFIEHLPVLADEKGAPGQPVDQSNRGLRVVRGRDWSWGDQDDGEGHVGTVEHFLVTQKVQVRWDNGQANHYYIGRHGRLDLRIFDNATVGVEHNSVTCDACKEHPVKGFRWKCKVCADYDLCTKCYMSDKHDTSHQFYRMTTSKSKKVLLPTRQGAKVEARGIFPGAVVVRGIDWTWENQDGGEGKTGVMSWGLKVKDGTPTRSWVEVKWDSSRVRADYRLGYKGYVDLKYTKDASGGHYYPDHLPLLGLDENSTTACDEEDPPIWEDASAITNEWYAGKISARDAVDKLTSPGIEVGTFLVRDSESLAGAYAISVRHLKTVKNYRVKRDENGFFIEKGRPFRTLPQLVNFYSQENTGILQLKHAFRQMFRDVIYESMDKKNDVDMNDRSALKIIGRLGGGSFGDVFAAEWNHQTKVAIKVLKKGKPILPTEFVNVI